MFCCLMYCQININQSRFPTVVFLDLREVLIDNLLGEYFATFRTISLVRRVGVRELLFVVVATEKRLCYHLRVTENPAIQWTSFL